MYQCIDHTLPHEEAEGKRKECFEKVLEKYKGFQEEWNKTHGFVARHDVNVTAANAANATVHHKVIFHSRYYKALEGSANATAHYKVTEADMKMINDVCD